MPHLQCFNHSIVATAQLKLCLSACQWLCLQGNVILLLMLQPILEYDYPLLYSQCWGVSPTLSIVSHTLHCLLRSSLSPTLSTVFHTLHCLPRSSLSPTLSTISHTLHHLPHSPLSPTLSTVSHALHCLPHSPLSPTLFTVSHALHCLPHSRFVSTVESNWFQWSVNSQTLWCYIACVVQVHNGLHINSYTSIRCPIIISIQDCPISLPHCLAGSDHLGI